MTAPTIPSIAALKATLVDRDMSDRDMAALAALAGVPVTSVWRARAGFAVNVTDHLKLAAALADRPCPALAVQWWSLAAGLRLRRCVERVSHRRAAVLSGVPVATFHRAENLRGRPSLSTYIRLAAFAGGGAWHYVTCGPCRTFHGKRAEPVETVEVSETIEVLSTEPRS